MKKLALLFVLVLSYASTATATTITFSEAGAVGGTSFLSSDGLVLAEWVWSIGLNDGHDHISGVGGNPGAYEQGHGQAFQGLRFSNVGGGAITLVSFDMQGDWHVSSLNDGSGTEYLSAFGSWTTKLANFTNTPYVYIYADDDFSSGWLDNVVLNQAPAAVPEPSSLLLLGGGLVAGVRRYRQRRA